MTSDRLDLAPADADLLAAFGEYLRLHVAQGDASPATLRTYRAQVGQFVAWCQTQGIAPAGAVADDLAEYRAHLVATGVARATIKARLAALRRFYAAAVWRGLRPDNPAAGLKAPREKTSQVERVKFLPRDVLQRLRAHLPAGGPVRARDLALLTLFVYHGPRVSELVALDLADLDLDSDPPGLVIRSGKGGKRRTLYLVAPEVVALRAWLTEREAHAAPGEAAVFVATRSTRDGEAGCRLSARGVRARVDRYLERADLKRPGVSCHALRHSFATWSAYAGADVASIAADMGHSSITTTGVYVQVADRMKQNPAARLVELFGE